MGRFRAWTSAGAVVAVVVGGVVAPSPEAVAGVLENGVARFDFGCSDSPVAGGYTQVANTTVYTTDRGFGLDNGTDCRDRGAPDDLRRDFTVGHDYVFQLDVPDGDYSVEVLSGDDIASNRTDVTVEGTDEGQIHTSTGQFSWLRAAVTVSDGQLDVTAGGDGRINAVVVTALPAPTGLHAAATTLVPDASVTLAWDPVPAATGYRLYRSPAGKATFSPIASPDTTRYTDGDVRLGFGYDYVVTALTADGTESARSASLRVSMTDPTVTPPGRPSGLALVSSTTQSRTIRWSPGDRSLFTYVERSASPDGPFRIIARTDGNEFTDRIDPVQRVHYRVLAVNTGGLSAPTAAVSAPATRAVLRRQAERLGRALVAVPAEQGVLVSWRLLPTDPRDVAFDVYRNGHRVTRRPVKTSTDFLDADGTAGAQYTVRAVLHGSIRERFGPVTAWSHPYLDIPIDKPAGGTTPDGVHYTYRANDGSVADLDGDGQYEIVLKWDPSNSKDNSQAGYTGDTYLDAYELSGERLWRIDLGRNIRAGAHYSPFLVYDFDGDGKAEVVAKTADGTVDGAGHVIGDPKADHRNSDGYILSGPEYLTVFNGDTGAAMDTVDYYPPRGDVCDWGDCYGNRVDRFLAAVAYLDGVHPSIVMTRGYYTRSVLVAYDWRGGKLTRRWVFDSDDWGRQYEDQGNHNLSVGDVDGDSRDEITYGAMAIDDDGTPLYDTHLGHGDAMHLGDLDPTHPGLEVFGVHENTDATYGMDFRDADSGKVLWGQFTGIDTARGLTGDIDPRHPGEEAWATGGEWNSPTGWLYSAQGELLSRDIPPANFAIWWDGDPGRELLDHDFSEATGVGVGTIGKWDYRHGRLVNLLTATGTYSDNGTKGNPVLQADLLGDWREEVIWRTEDSSALRLYATPYPTDHRMPTLMSDPIYRLGIAWQNVGYNQPPHTSYFLGHGMKPAPVALLQTGPEVQATVRLTPRVWQQGTGTIHATVALPPALAQAGEPTDVRLVVDGHAVQAQGIRVAGGPRPDWHVMFDAAPVHSLLAGVRGTVAVAVVGYLADGRTVVAHQLVTLC